MSTAVDCPNLTIDYAVEGDAEAILGILAETFPGEILARTPLGCAGARRYVVDTISHRSRSGDVVWLVARDLAVVGFVEMRVAPQELFLNHIHVSPSRQGQGIGGRLLRRSIELTRPPEAQQIGLSVFRDRTPHIRWYERLSFLTVQTSHWVTLRLGDRGPQGWFGLGELPQADCVHTRYGFSSFLLRTHGGTYRLGRLGDRFFRTQDAAILNDLAALGALTEIGPDRELVITSAGEELLITVELPISHTATATQMSAEIDRVLARLPGG